MLLFKKRGILVYIIGEGNGTPLQCSCLLIGDDVAQCGLAQSRRTMKQHMVQRLAAQLGRSDKHAQVLDNLVLPGKVLKPNGSQRPLKVLIGLQRLSPDVKFLLHINCKDSASREKCQIYLSISKAQPILAQGKVVQAERNAKFI